MSKQMTDVELKSLLDVGKELSDDFVKAVMAIRKWKDTAKSNPTLGNLSELLGKLHVTKFTLTRFQNEVNYIFNDQKPSKDGE